MAFLLKFFQRKRRDKVEPVSPALPQQEEVVADRIQTGWLTHIGQQRKTNEDAILVAQAVQDGDHSLPPFDLLVLADGMGGHKSGEVVSALAARTVARHILQQVYLAALSQREHSAAQPSITEVLVESINLANATVAAVVPGGGTTVTCAMLLGSQAYIANVGDSRTYLVSADGLEQITRDHSLVDRLVELGQLTLEEAANHPQKNVLYRAVGQSGVLEVDTFIHSLSPGQGLLLCSDGLWGMLSDGEMAEIIAQAPSAQAACNALVAAANQAGGRDNISVILARFPEHNEVRS